MLWSGQTLQVERLGDYRHEVRQKACNTMLGLLRVVRPDLLMDKLSRFWDHKHWKVCLLGPGRIPEAAAWSMDKFCLRKIVTNLVP
jgi:hypothetical protein